jgi:hypothetical protein
MSFGICKRFPKNFTFLRLTIVVTERHANKTYITPARLTPQLHSLFMLFAVRWLHSKPLCNGHL